MKKERNGRRQEKALAANAQATSAIAVADAPGRGFGEEDDREDLILPVARLIQPNSPEVMDQGLKPGTLINSITKENLPAEFIPILKFKRWIKFAPAEAGRGVEWMSSNPRDPRVIQHAKWGENGEKPAVTAFLNFLSVFNDDFMHPVILGFCNTSYKTGKQLYSIAKFSGGDLFSRRYAVTSVKTKNDKGTFFVLKVELVGTANEAQRKSAEALYNSFSAKKDRIVSHEEEIGQEEEAEEAPF